MRATVTVIPQRTPNGRSVTTKFVEGHRRLLEYKRHCKNYLKGFEEASRTLHYAKGGRYDIPYQPLVPKET